MTPREDVKKAIEELRAKIGVAEEVRLTMESRGWTEYISPLLEVISKKMNSVEGVETIAELKARQATVRALKELQKGLNAIIDDANGAIIELQQQEEHERLLDEAGVD